MTLGSTPWVDRSFKSILSALEQKVPASWLPRTISEKTEEYTVGFDPTRHSKTTRFKKPVVEELGCGHYGCVMPTHEPDLVFKITTDVSEAAFVARALELESTAGIVEYKAIYSTGLQHKGRPLFVLWRTEAFSVGEWQYSRTHPAEPNKDYARRIDHDASKDLAAFLSWAKIVRAYMHPRLREIQTKNASIGPSSDDGVWRSPLSLKRLANKQAALTGAAGVVEERRALLKSAWSAYERGEAAQDMSLGQLRALKGMPKVGVALRTCLYIAQEMSSNPSLYRVGEALAHYLENGILLADVHANNLGLDSEGEVLITDPGHAVEFHPRWVDTPRIERLPGM